ncbi:MAG: hypothetical protein CME06_06240 [Gemmatimonadetes bacterium]|nr:hypothetical protein [Gemmatimonadota bacterium]
MISRYNALPEALDDALYSNDPAERDRARAYLRAHADAGIVESIAELLGAGTRLTRRRAERILWEMPVSLTRPALLGLALDRSGRPAERARAIATRLLAAQSDEDAELADRILADGSARVRRAVLTASTPVAALERAIGDSDPSVAARAAEIVCRRGEQGAIDPEVVRAAIDRHRSPPEALLRALATIDPAAAEVGTRAIEGESLALDHASDPGVLRALLSTEYRASAAWGLARAGAVSDELVEELLRDPDARVRSAVARALAPEDSRLEALANDVDRGVAWLAKRSRAGDYRAAKLSMRRRRHERSGALSATPPYGIKGGGESSTSPPASRLHAALALCQTRLDVNLGAAVRSADAAGLREVFLVGRGELQRAASRGTEDVLPIAVVADPAALIRAARLGGYQIVGIQQTPASHSYHRAPYPPRPLFVAGAEAEGLPAALRVGADLLVEIPHFGEIDSLNVAAAVSVVLFEWRMGVEGV